ncbi:MAG TPA: hypothetical protein VE870_13950, partial [Bacteroidales bacterium]|nr:hypothetical protein [Bacteroidales bacterium]
INVTNTTSTILILFMSPNYLSVTKIFITNNCYPYSPQPVTGIQPGKYMAFCRYSATKPSINIESRIGH